MESGSAPARLIDQNEFSVKGIRVAVRVYEEAASSGLRRTQMTVTMASDGKGTQTVERCVRQQQPSLFLQETADGGRTSPHRRPAKGVSITKREKSLRL